MFKKLLTTLLLSMLVVQGAQATTYNTIHDLREAKEAMFNRTMTKIAGAATAVTNNIETIVNHTAIKLMSAKHRFHNSLDEHASKMAARREYSEKRWAEWRNKTEEHLQPVKDMLETMHDAVKTKVVAKVDLLHQKGNIMSDFFKTMFGSVVDMVQKTRVNIIKNKKEETRSESKDAIMVHLGKAISTPQLLFKFESRNTTDLPDVPVILYAN